MSQATKPPRRPTLATLQKECDRFNERHPIGTPVRYWKGIREGDGLVSNTATIAQVLGGHTAVVWVESEGSCIALTHIQRV